MFDPEESLLVFLGGPGSSEISLWQMEVLMGKPWETIGKPQENRGLPGLVNKQKSY